MAEVGERYRNTTGAALFGFFPPDAVVEVVHVGDADDTGFHGTVVVQYDPEDDLGVMRNAGLTADELADQFELVGSEENTRG